MAEIATSPAHVRDSDLWPRLRAASEEILANGEVDSDTHKKRRTWRAAGQIGLDLTLERPVERIDQYRLHFTSFTERSRPWGVYSYGETTGGISVAGGELTLRTERFDTSSDLPLVVHERQLEHYLASFGTEGSSYE